MVQRVIERREEGNTCHCFCLSTYSVSLCWLICIVVSLQKFSMIGSILLQMRMLGLRKVKWVLFAEIGSQDFCLTLTGSTGYALSVSYCLQAWMSLELGLVQKCHGIDSFGALWEPNNYFTMFLLSFKLQNYKNRYVSNLGTCLDHQRMVVALAFEVLNYRNHRLVFNWAQRILFLSMHPGLFFSILIQLCNCDKKICKRISGS